MSQTYKRRPSPSEYSQAWNNAEFAAVERSQSDGPYLPEKGGTIAGDVTLSDDQIERFIKSSKNGGAIRLRANSGAGTDRGLWLGTVDNVGTFTKYISISNGAIGFFGNAGISAPTITGSKGGNAALASLLTALASFGLIVDSTT